MYLKMFRFIYSSQSLYLLFITTVTYFINTNQDIPYQCAVTYKQ